MAKHTDAVRFLLSRGPATARQLAEKLGISQPTVSRALTDLGAETFRLGVGRAIQYALRDPARGLPEIPVHRISDEGKLSLLGTLIPVRPEGFVMQQEDGYQHHSEGLPWWLFDMRPQGFLGRAYATRHAAQLGLPQRLSEWNDTHALRALLAHGHDAIGNLLLGDQAREQFLSDTSAPIAMADKAATYHHLAEEAARGELPGSSAGGEQPKFTAYAETPEGPRHVLVKFTSADDNPITERWRDLLLAEHLALETLRDSGIPAVTTRLIDVGAQRFLEVERFDREGVAGRHGVFSLAALDAEFVGAGARPWPSIVAKLAAAKIVRPEATAKAALLYAFGTLIGNTDMHPGNLSFISDSGAPCALAPAYDMLPMGFCPTGAGTLRDTLQPARVIPEVDNGTWRQAEELAGQFRERIANCAGLSPRFDRCREALALHLHEASRSISRLG